MFCNNSNYRNYISKHFISTIIKIIAKATITVEYRLIICTRCKQWTLPKAGENKMCVR